MICLIITDAKDHNTIENMEARIPNALPLPSTSPAIIKTPDNAEAMQITFTTVNFSFNIIAANIVMVIGFMELISEARDAFDNFVPRNCTADDKNNLQSL